MLFTQLLALSLALAPDVVSAALFPKNSLVKSIDRKGFKKAMKENMTSIVAFTAPWCGHCQKMAPEFNKAALGLYPLVPMYNVDCDEEKNKRLCAEQGVSGFPTIKLFPRGNDMDPVPFTGPQRSASEFFYFGKKGIPYHIKKIRYIEDFENDVNNEEAKKKHRAILMNKTNKMPILWTTLGNKYRDQLSLYTHRDRRGKSSVKLGFEKGGDEPKVLIIPAGETKPVQFQGLLKFDSLSTFFDSLLDGTANLDELNAAAAAEQFNPDPEELEIEKQQEAEMLKLAHGGFSDMIDFEAAVRDGSAQDFHAKNGFPGMMGGVPPHMMKQDKEETEKKEEKKGSGMPATDDAGQMVFENPTGSGSSSQTATASEDAATETPDVVDEPIPEPEEDVLEEAEKESAPDSESVKTASSAESDATQTHAKDEL